MKKLIILIILFSVSFFSFSQEKDYRKIYTKKYFEEWYQKSDLTILENDTLKALQEIVDLVQKSYVERKASLHDDDVTFHLNTDSLGRVTKERLIEMYGEKNATDKKEEYRKYLFYNAALPFGIFDSVISNYIRRDLPVIYFKPAIEQFKGKVIYIDSLDQERFKKLGRDLNTENDNAMGYYYFKGFTSRSWYSYYLEYATPFNQHIQSIIHSECLDYSGTVYVDLRPVNTIKSIVLTKDLKEAAVEIEPTWSIYYYIKENGKWIMNKNRKPLIKLL